MTMFEIIVVIALLSINLGVWIGVGKMPSKKEQEKEPNDKD